MFTPLCRGRRQFFNLLPSFSSAATANACSSSFSTQPQLKPNSSSSSLSVSLCDVSSCNRKISDLGQHGRVREARLLFDQMPGRDPDSYASMITAYLKCNDLFRAEQLFRIMPHTNVIAGSAMVHAYALAGRIVDARKLFDEMPHRNVYSWTSLISGYFRGGLVDEASRLFDQMPEKNAVSWTTALVGFARNGLLDKARSVFDQMPDKTIVAWTAMMKSYADSGRINEACQLFHAMPHRNLYSWNIIISACLDDRRVTDAIQLFDSMRQRNAVSWTTMVTGLARNGFIDQARKYFDRIPWKDIAAWNAMITAYANEGLVIEAAELFDLMPNRDAATWNSMIDAYARSGNSGEALKLMGLMLQSQSIRPNEKAITSVLTACQGMLELTQAHALVILLGFEHDRPLTNTLISMYSRIGDLGSASLAFENLEAKDVVSWTVMILAYSYYGYGYHALHAFARMLRWGAIPDKITFVGILSACSHAGLVKKGRRIFESMIAFGLEPRTEHYACLVDILGRAGLLGEAMEVLSKIPLPYQDAGVLGALLGACKLHGNVELANSIAKRLVELEPSNSRGYILLASTYAAEGKWDESAVMRKRMKQKRVKKEPGFSSIEIQGKNHFFLVGDKNYSEVSSLCQTLQEILLPEMQQMGYSFCLQGNSS